MKLTKDYITYIAQYETIITSGIVILFVLIMSVLFLVPNIEKAKIIYTQQQELKKKLEKLRSKENVLSAIDADYYKDIFTKMNYVLPESKDYVSLFSTFDELEQKTGVRFLRTDVQLGVISTGSGNLQRVPGSSAFMIPVTMDVMGGIPALNSLFASLTDLSGRILTVESIQLGTKGAGIYQVTLNGRAYYYPLPANLGDVDAPLVQIPKDKEVYLQKISQITISHEDTATIEVGKKNIFIE